MLLTITFLHLDDISEAIPLNVEIFYVLIIDIGVNLSRNCGLWSRERCTRSLRWLLSAKIGINKSVDNANFHSINHVDSIRLGDLGWSTVRVIVN